MSAHIRTPAELQLHAAVAKLAAVPQGAVLAAIRTQAANVARAVTPTTLRERALHTALRWISHAPDGTSLAEIRTYASGAIAALNVSPQRLGYWCDYTERRIQSGTAGRALV